MEYYEAKNSNEKSILIMTSFWAMLFTNAKQSIYISVEEYIHICIYTLSNTEK